MKGTYIALSGPSSEYLEAVDAHAGTLLWRKDCPTGWYLDMSQADDGENTPTQQLLGVSCDGNQMSLDPLTGTAQ
jgi:hypothetical protein